MSASIPNWLTALAEECKRQSQAKVASRIGYSAATVSQVLKGVYKGDLKAVEDAVTGALLGANVTCPVMGAIAKNKCLEYQRLPFAATSPQRAQLYQACRAGCPNSRIEQKHGRG